MTSATDTTTVPEQPRPVPDWRRTLHSTLTRVRTDPGALAACRRGLGKPSMYVPAMWEYVAPVADVAHAERPGLDRRVEQATHHALALYAAHQQSLEAPMHVGPRDGERDRSLGEACRILARKRAERGGRPGEPDEGVRRRFLAAATADSLSELVGHLRGLVSLLRTEQVPLDYVRLAQDLVDWPDPVRLAQVRRRWGRDFHRVPAEPTGDTATTPTAS